MLQKIMKYVFYVGLGLIVGSVTLGGVTAEGVEQGVQIGLGLAGAITLLIAYIKKEQSK